MKHPSTHSIIFLSLCNWHCYWLFVRRVLANNQLKVLPEGIFRNNFNLYSLWVDLFLFNSTLTYLNCYKSIRLLLYQYQEIGDINSLAWYGYDIMLIWPNFSVIKIYWQLFSTLRRHVRLIWSRQWHFGSATSRQITSRDSSHVCCF